MKLGIAGSGMIVADLLSFVREIPGITLKAIYGRAESRVKLEALQTSYGISRIYHDYDELLNDEEVDTVYIGLPNHLHYSYTKKALLGGKHVICEKPFTSNLREFLELRELAEQHDVVLAEAISNQYLTNYQLLKAHLDELGEIKIVECNYSQYSSRYDAFQAGEVLPAFDPEKSGGALMDINIYNIHFVVGLFGSPVRVEYWANMERGIDTSGMLLLDYGSFKCVCIGAKDSSAPNTVKIQGNKGYIHVAGSANGLDGFEYVLNKKQAVRVDEQQHPHRMYEEFLAFERMIAGRDLAEAGARLSHSERVMRVVESAKQSSGLTFGPDR